MQVKTDKKDSVNIVVSAKVSKEAVDKMMDKLTNDYSKNVKIDGFRKGKVPTAVIKQRYGNELTQDSRSQLLQEVLGQAKTELKIEDSKVLGEPRVIDFKEEGEGFEAEIKIELRPDINLGDYNSLVPDFKAAEASDDEVKERLDLVAKSSVEPEKIARKRMVREGDFVVIDFEGFVDGEAFEGGKAEQYTLEIGSNSFIPGFEDQIVGMKYDEEKDITVTFPENYGKAELAGKEAVFKVKLHEIKEKKAPEYDDELAKKLLPTEENPNMDLVKEKIKEQLENEKLTKLYNDELKPQLMDLLVENIDFDLPETIVEQEVDIKINQELQGMSMDDAKKIVESQEEVDKLKDKYKDEASKSVKATFIMDELARAESITADDNEVLQTIYYEAMSIGQNPQQVVEYYQKNNFLPAIKMGIIEDKILNKLLNRKIGKEG